jgi:hypothetical protein
MHDQIPSSRIAPAVRMCRGSARALMAIARAALISACGSSDSSMTSSTPAKTNLNNTAHVALSIKQSILTPARGQRRLPRGGAAGKRQDLRMHRDDTRSQTAIRRQQDAFRRHCAERQRLRHLRGEVGARRGGASAIASCGAYVCLPRIDSFYSSSPWRLPNAKRPSWQCRERAGDGTRRWAASGASS